MTKRTLNFEKLEVVVEECKTYQKNLKAREEKYSKMLDYQDKAKAIQNELKNPVDKPNAIDNFGILSYINCYRYYSNNDNLNYNYDEARIVNIVDNNFIVETDKNNRYKILIDEIRKKGYYYNSEESQLIFVDRIDNSARFKELIDIIVKQRKKNLLEAIERQKEWIKKYQDELKNLEEMLPQYDDYKIGNVDKIAKHISFALDLDDEQIEEFENDFPRVYKV